MKSFTIVMLAAVLLLPSCQYRGAVYVSHTHVGVGVKSSPEAASPIDMNIGYNHEVIAFVPKREGETMPGESAALISMSDTQIMSRPGSSTVLKVRDGLITGSAAIAASVPDGSVISATVGGASGASTEVTGNVGDRIGAAFVATPLYPFVMQEELQQAFEAAEKAKDPEAVFAQAATNVDEVFKKAYDMAKSRPSASASFAFGEAKDEYLVKPNGLSREEAGVRRTKLYYALRGAMKD